MPRTISYGLDPDSLSSEQGEPVDPEDFYRPREARFDDDPEQ